MIYCEKCAHEKGWLMAKGGAAGKRRCGICSEYAECFEAEDNYLSCWLKWGAMFEGMKSTLTDYLYSLKKAEKNLAEEGGKRLEVELGSTWAALRFSLDEAEKCMDEGAWPMALKRMLDAEHHYGEVAHHLTLKALMDVGIVWGEMNKEVVEKPKKSLGEQSE